MRGFLLIGLGALAAGCSYGPPAPMAPNPTAQAHLARELAGLVPTQAQSCLPHYRSQDMVVIDDSTLLFRDGQNLVYRNNLRGRCRLGPGYTLVTRSIGNGLCGGDIAQVADLSTGMVVGSCVLGDFIPYRRP